MDELTMIVSLMSGLALFVNRTIESLKPYAALIPMTDDKRKGLLTAASLALGILFALIMQVNAFSTLTLYEYQIPPLTGVIVTGVFVGSGSNAVHWLAEALSVLNSLRRPTTNVSTVTETRTTEVATTTPPVVGAPTLGTTGVIPPADVEAVFAQFEDDERTRLAG